MQTAYPDIPPGLVDHDLTSAAVQLQLDATLYPLQAIYGAAGEPHAVLETAAVLVVSLVEVGAEERAQEVVVAQVVVNP